MFIKAKRGPPQSNLMPPGQHSFGGVLRTIIGINSNCATASASVRTAGCH